MAHTTIPIYRAIYILLFWFCLYDSKYYGKTKHTVQKVSDDFAGTVPVLNPDEAVDSS